MQKEFYKSANASETTITELMVPSYANFGGKIHGGVILSLMDKVAYVCACKHARAYCVTASIDTVDFLQSVEVGELVSLQARVIYVGRTSMVIGITVDSENVTSDLFKHTNTSYFTMVAKDEQNRPLQVPGLLLESETDIRKFMEAIRRKSTRQKVKEETQQIKVNFNLSEAMLLLRDERCVVDEKTFNID